MALSRLVLAWLGVTLWLLLWELVVSRFLVARGNGKLHQARVLLVEALLLTMLGGLWFGSLGSGGWWLVFGLVGALREWPGPRARRAADEADPIGVAFAALRVLRTMAAGGILAWRLGPS
jgi:hypothetical protein